jgi:hypothetical protein
MYGPAGMPYGGYPMGPYGVNSIGNMPLQFPSAMQGNLANTHWYVCYQTCYLTSTNSKMTTKLTNRTIWSRDS